MEGVPGKTSVEEECKNTDCKAAGALKLKLRTQKTLPTMASSDSGDYDNECN